MDSSKNDRDSVTSPQLAARLGVFDATMIVMGGIVGSGIFINPYVVARQVHTPALILGAWSIGGIVALVGAFIYAELAARLPRAGGQYAYLREAYHPAVAFLYGWVLLLVIQTGGMAAVAVTFAKYLQTLVRVPISDAWIATFVLVGLAIINCLGVRAGSTVQSTLMVLKILAIAALVFAGAWIARPATSASLWHPVLDRPVSFDLLTAIGAALTPVLFAFGGWQTANFIAPEVREPRRNLPRALVLRRPRRDRLYLAVNYRLPARPRSGGSRRHGHSGDRSDAPRARRIRHAAYRHRHYHFHARLPQPIHSYCAARLFRDGKRRIIFSQCSLARSAPPRPGCCDSAASRRGMVIALSGKYEQILNYVVSMDFIFFGLTATCYFVFRRRDERRAEFPLRPAAGSFFRMPGHPFTTASFIAISWLVVANTIYKYPGNTLIGMVSFWPVYPSITSGMRRSKLSH